PSTKELWAVLEGQRFQVKHHGATPDFEDLAMALSPDGRWLATLAPVEKVPASWESLFPPPQFYSITEIQPHPIVVGRGTAKQFVRIDLKSGAIEPLVDAPSMDSVGILGGGGPAWSDDGAAILLPGTFLKAKENEPARPCVAIVNVASKSSGCVVTPKEGYTKNTDPVDNYHRPVDVIVGARFAFHDQHRVQVTFDTRDGTPGRTTSYERGADGAWKALGETIGAAESGPNGLEVRIKETF